MLKVQGTRKCVITWINNNTDDESNHPDSSQNPGEKYVFVKILRKSSFTIHKTDTLVSL